MIFKMSDLIPNLFIIGAMKSGTTSLHNYLQEHPEIFMSKFKEPQYFSRIEYSSETHAAYLSLFNGSENMRFRGESSTNYTKSPLFSGVAKRIHEFNPEARLIYLMREPFDRAISQYKHHVRMGRESRNLRSAFHSESEYFANSYYAMQLRPYFELFGKDAVFLSTFEAFTKDPQSICLQIFAWLGLNTSFVPPNLGKRYYESPTQILNMRRNSIMFKLRSLIKKSDLMNRFIPSIFKTLYDRMTPQYIALDVHSEPFNREMNEARKEFRSQFVVWNAELAEMTGLSLSEWSHRS